MKSFIYLILFLTSFSQIHSQTYNPLIDELINQTNLDSLVSFVRILSGEDSVIIGGTKVVIHHRVSNNNNNLAADYIKQKLEEYGLDTYDQLYYDPYGRNIYAIQPGILYPDEQYIICAHYDAVDFYCADDDASGVAAVLEAARILSNYELDYTLIYALWDEEEIGLYGSGYYAEQAFINNDDILGVVNLEMVGWDSNDDGKMDIHTKNIANSVTLANLVYNIVSVYNLSLDPVIYNPGTNSSDHFSFWSRGYSAIVFSEAFYGGDFNPYYHTSGDRVQNFNLPYFHKLAKLAVGSISTLVEVNPLVSVENEELLIPLSFKIQNYPNPFNPSTTVQFSVPFVGDSHITPVQLKVYNVLGDEVATLVNDERPSGTYEVEWNASGLSSGVYIVTLISSATMINTKMILLK
jgi:hypothetical protein